MRDVVMLFQEAGAFGWLLLFGMVAGGLWAFVSAVLLALKWRVPPVLSALPLLLTPLTAAVGAVAAQGSIDAAVAGVEPAYKATILAAGTAELLALALLTTTVLPAALLLGMGGLVAGIRAPRAWGVPAVSFFFAILVAFLPSLGLVWSASVPWAVARTLVYGAAAIPLALATSSGHPGKNGPEGGVTAAAAFVATVASMELAYVASCWRDLFGALAAVSPDDKVAMLTTGSASVSLFGTLAWVAVGCASVPLLVTAFRPAPTLTEEEILAGLAGESPWRGVGRVLALGVPVAWGIALLALDPTEVLQRIATSY